MSQIPICSKLAAGKCFWGMNLGVQTKSIIQHAFGSLKKTLVIPKITSFAPSSPTLDAMDFCQATDCLPLAPLVALVTQAGIQGPLQSEKPCE